MDNVDIVVARCSDFVRRSYSYLLYLIPSILL